MTSKLFPSLLCSIIIFFFSTSNCVADQHVVPSNNIVDPDTACSACLDPSYCKSVLPRSGSNGLGHTISELSWSLITRSKVSAIDFLSIIDKQLKGHSSTPSDPYIEALEDCRLLLGLNVDYLEDTLTTMKYSTKALPTLEVHRLLTMLSAVLTNHQTCLDGLEFTNVGRGWGWNHYTTLSEGSKLHSVSLGLFNTGWGQKAIKFKGNSDGDDNVRIRGSVVVNPNGSGDFTTINEAVAAASNNTHTKNGYFRIHVVAGVYEEYVSIAKNQKYLMILGDGINKTVITGNRSVVDGWTTFNSATLAVGGTGFVAINITVRNTAGPVKHQAVAVRNGADLSTFYSCSFEGYQDTLYTHSNRQFYRECDIYGTVDFIFGNGAVVLQECNIYPRLPMQGQFNAITAQGRSDPNHNTGISIHNCTITAAPDLAASSGTTQTYLGRPWKEYSRTVYMQSSMGSLIDSSGWHEWNGDYALSTLYYAPYNNTGPGSDTSNRVTWPGYHRVIGYTNATDFTVSNFISGDSWLPATGVPFNGGFA